MLLKTSPQPWPLCFIAAMSSSDRAFDAVDAVPEDGVEACWASNSARAIFCSPGDSRSKAPALGAVVAVGVVGEGDVVWAAATPVVTKTPRSVRVNHVRFMMCASSASFCGLGGSWFVLERAFRLHDDLGGGRAVFEEPTLLHIHPHAGGLASDAIKFDLDGAIAGGGGELATRLGCLVVFEVHGHPPESLDGGRLQLLLRGRK